MVARFAFKGRGSVAKRGFRENAEDTLIGSAWGVSQKGLGGRGSDPKADGRADRLAEENINPL
jgi:hypothetical protein